MKIDIKRLLDDHFRKVCFGWDIRGVIDSNSRIYTITDDTKLISKVFELISFPIITEALKTLGGKIEPSDRQTVYPDLTLVLPTTAIPNKIALDVKTTFRRPWGAAGFTLGSYTAYLRNNTKNIMYPYDHYLEHWVVGFIYTRSPGIDPCVVDVSLLSEILPVIKDIEIIIEEKWRIASDRPGSGNTANIGSVNNLSALRSGRGTFTHYKHGELVFEDYWRNYVTKIDARNAGLEQRYNNVKEYFAWRRQHATEEVKLPAWLIEQLSLAAEADDVPH